MADSYKKEIQKWYSQEQALRPKEDKRSKNKPKENKKPREPIEKGWLSGVIEMIEDAIIYADELGMQDKIPILQHKLALAHEGFPGLIKPPLYEPDFYEIDAKAVLSWKLVKYQTIERKITEQQHVFPYIRGKSIGGISREEFRILHSIYCQWAKKTIRERGPRYLAPED